MVESWLNFNKLSLNHSKTKYLLIKPLNNRLEYNKFNVYVKGGQQWHLENISKIALIYFEPSSISMTLKTHSLSKNPKLNVPLSW